MLQSISCLMSYQSEKRNKRVDKRFVDHKSKIQNFAFSVNILGQFLSSLPNASTLSPSFSFIRVVLFYVRRV